MSFKQFVAGESKVNLKHSTDPWLAAVINSSGEALIGVTTGGEVACWNRGAENIFGYTEPEVRGQNISMLAVPGSQPATNQMVKEINRGAETLDYQALLRGKNGESVEVSLNISPVREAGGEIIGAVLTTCGSGRFVRSGKYRALFDSIDEGYALCEVIYDPRGDSGGDCRVAVDIRYLEVNPAFSRLSGLENAAGKLATEMNPAIDFYWIATCARVAESGDGVRFESYAEGLNRWIDIYFSRVGEADSRQIAVIFKDITERRRREANLAFLMEVAEDLARFSSADEIMQAVGAKTGAYLQIATCNFIEIDEVHDRLTVNYAWHKSDVPSLKQTFRLSDHLSEELRRAGRGGEITVVGDTALDPRTRMDNYAALKIGSLVTVPFLRGGEWQSSLSVTGTAARDWREDEIQLILELAKGIFARLERARAEEALRFQELLLNTVEQSVIATDLSGRITYWNRFAEDLFGWTREEAIGRSVIALTTPQMIAEKAREIMSTLRLGKSWDGEFTLRKSDGAIFPGYISNTPINDHQGHLIGIAGVSFDLSPRQKAEEALQESRKRLQLAANVSGFGLHDFNIATGELYWSPELKGMHGLPDDFELSFESLLQFVYADDQEQLALTMQEALNPKSDGVFEQEFRIIRIDTGETRWLFNKSQTYFSGSGKGRKPIRNTGIVIDVTSRKRAEKALRESEERLRLVLDSVTDYAIITTDAGNTITDWNPGAEKTFGWTRDEAIGKPGNIIFSAEDRERKIPEKEIEAVLTTGSVADERYYTDKNGKRFYASGNLTPLKDRGTEGFVRICRDLTEKIKAEKAIREKEILRKLVRAQEDERKRIARDLHDELGQELSVLRLKLETIKKLCTDETLCAQIDETQITAQRIDDGVDFIAWELRPAALDHLGLFAALDKFVREWSRYCGVAAELLGSSLMNTRFAPEVEINLYRIVQEALNNIHKHAAAKNVEVMIKKRDALLVLIIEDDGRGFDAENKINRTKGIGLVGMQERAELAGGSLEIESTPGLGTTIHVRIPFSHAPEVKT